MLLIRGVHNQSQDPLSVQLLTEREGGLMRKILIKPSLDAIGIRVAVKDEHTLGGSQIVSGPLRL